MATARKSTSKALAKSQAIKKIIARLEKAHPAAKLDLDFANPLELLVALILVVPGLRRRVEQSLRSNCLHDGYVTDFLNVGIGTLRTGIFNAADMTIMAGTLVFPPQPGVEEP